MSGSPEPAPLAGVGCSTAARAASSPAAEAASAVVRDVRLTPRMVSLGGRGLLDAAGQQRLARDHEPLDLRGALVELHDLGVAHELLDGVLLDEAVAAVDLHGVRRDLHG